MVCVVLHVVELCCKETSVCNAYEPCDMESLNNHFFTEYTPYIITFIKKRVSLGVFGEEYFLINNLCTQTEHET